MSEKKLFVINPGSGAGRINWKKEIETYYREREKVIDFFLLSKPPDIDQLKRYLETRQPHTVVAVGGDGTVNLLASLLAGTDIPLGILPGGSANGMASELTIPEEPEKALDILESGKVTPVDTILINNQYVCLHLSDIGLNAQLIKYFEEDNLRGKLGYAKVVLKTLIRKRRLKISLIKDDKIIEAWALMLVLANAGQYGTGAVINPGGVINDGLFEVVIVRRLAIKSILKMLLKPQPFDTKNIEIVPCTAIAIKSRRKVHFQVDGEYLGKVKNIQAKIQAGNLLMILPQNYVNR